ncbi:OsmC family protein [Erythrobacter sp. HA6-11]
MASEHTFPSRIVWTGNTGRGTQSYKSYERTWDIAMPGVLPVACSNDPRLGGDPSKPNPEDLLISALAACHMLWYLHLASEAGVVVQAYEDCPQGIGRSESDGSGRFVAAILRPKITLAPGTDLDRARAIHGEIHKVCFIARSVNFPIEIEPEFAS